MAGRPRTMAKRVAQLLERHKALANELSTLMPTHYRHPDTAAWELEAADAHGDELTQAWREAVFEVDWASQYIQDLACFLLFKAEEAEKGAKSAKAAGSIRGADDRHQGNGLASS